MKIETKNYPQVYLEECKSKIKKRKMSRFIDVELELDYGSDCMNDCIYLLTGGRF